MKFINYVKIQKFKVAPLPEWSIQKGIKYQYDIFPSIIAPQDDAFQIVDSTEKIKIELQS